MPIATPRRYAEMLDAAHDGAFAYPAVNVTSSQTLNAALEGFAHAGSDGIVQVTVGGAAYLGGGDALAGAQAFAAAAHELAARVDVSIALHTDHCPPARVDDFLRPLIATRRFNSHMFDGSTLPLGENLARSRELLDATHAAGLVLEVEVGAVGGEEDGIAGEALYTTTDDLLEVARVLGTGERGRYLLAATFGNVHGLSAPERVRLRPEILREGQEALQAGRFDYVFHGSSGTPVAELQRTLAYGVVKVNVDSESQLAFTRAVADHLAREFDSSGVRKAAYDPRAWGRAGEAAMAETVAQACRTLGSAGRAR
ncbi:class II fructose-bisphosphate aldolase [Solirubrobacter soli]|uniref:class II fructose-bisphosphate aldolase n=1 Tax=Solirubrobacter soli TaxID=363832 RepID=UPI000487BBAE|nr:class II fructose-bisphosphate aldolase [Solirubrobacter soli]